MSRTKIAACLVLGYVFCISQILFAGGKPNPGTPKDKRLKENKPAQQKPAQQPPKKAK